MHILKSWKMPCRIYLMEFNLFAFLNKNLLFYFLLPSYFRLNRKWEEIHSDSQMIGKPNKKEWWRKISVKHVTFLPLWGEKERPKRNAKMRDWGSTNFPPSSELMYLGKLRRTFFIWRRTLIVFYGFVYLHDLYEWWWYISRWL